MSVSAVVVRVGIAREKLAVPELVQLFGIKELPLAPSYVEIELDGVPTAVVNAIRRVVTDELPGRALQVPADGFDVEKTTEVFMLPQFVNARISGLRLRPQIPPEVVNNLRLRLDVTNNNASVMGVYAGDLEVAAGSMPEPLFNPTTKLAELQPGKRIVIGGISVSTGVGRDNGVYNVACRAAYTHLDLPQHTDDEMRLPPNPLDKKSTDGVAADWSGFRTSSLVADPRRHLLTAVLPSTTANAAEARSVFADACANIKERLRLIATAIERGANAGDDASRRGVQYTIVLLENGLTEGIIKIPGETHTIGELLRRFVYELAPDVANVSYIIVAHENRLNFSVRHGNDDVTRILSKAIKHAIETFDVIQRGITRG